MATHATIKKQRSRDAELVREIVAERRRTSITSREAARHAALKLQKEKEAKDERVMSTKYPKADIRLLKEIFDMYDMDGNGAIERAELVQALEKQKSSAQRVDPLKKRSLEERQAQQGKVRGQAAHKKGVFLVDFSESLFRAMDANNDSRVEFAELLRLLYPFASESELQTMLSWVATIEPEVTINEFTLSDEQRRDVHSMFRMYDKDNSGQISPAEFRQAMKRCGLDAAETEALFEQGDVDGNQSIDLAEFTALMRQILFEGEGLTRSMIYAP